MLKAIFIVTFLILLTGCDSDPSSVCGDGQAGGDEQCDGLDTSGLSCADLGFYSGNLACLSDCTFDTFSCSGFCGNNIIDGNETCDGTDTGDRSCISEGFYGGDIACTADCQLDISDCIPHGKCSDGIINGSEECDGSDTGEHTCQSLGYHEGNLLCKADCTYDLTNCEWNGYCGNGIIEPDWEYCDGASLNDETCSSQGYYRGTLGCTDYCGFDNTGCERCGDGIIQSADGEECDTDNLGANSCYTLYGIVGDGLACNHECRYDAWDCTYYLQMGGPESEKIWKIHIEPDNTIYIAGVDDGYFSGIYDNDRSFIVHLTAGGTVLQQLGIDAYYGQAERDESGNWYFLGSFDDGTKLVKYNSALSEEWSITLVDHIPTGYTNRYSESFAITKTGDFYIRVVLREQTEDVTALMSFDSTGSYKWIKFISGRPDSYGLIPCGNNILFGNYHEQIPDTYSILTMMSEDGSQLWNIDFSYWQVPGDCLLARPLYCDDSNIYLNA
ncbi:hypothetical protein KKD49_03640, partial [Myxococcota bacterium]|nr:hypothetical protein [Myxococcota bacterium]